MPIWWHYLCITVPNVIKRPEYSFLWIDGTNNQMPLPQPTDNFVELSSVLAVGVGSIGATLFQVPNEPIVFKADPSQKSRHEDGIIAWTWKTFIQNPSDPTILLSNKLNFK